MKFNTFSVASTIVLASSVCAIENAAVYRFNPNNELNCNDDNNDKTILTISQNDAELNLAYNFGISRYYNIENVDNLDNIMLSNNEKVRISNKLLLVINGVEQPSKFLQDFNIDPDYNIEIKDDRSSLNFKTFLKNVPHKLSELKKYLGFKKETLSNEITLLTPNNDKKSLYLKQVWNKYFHNDETNKIEKIWSNLKNSISSTNNNQGSESILKIDKRSINHIVDESFINELTQLEFFLNEKFQDYKNEENESIIITIDSLISIFKKTGITQTYETCLDIISNILVEKLQNLENVDTTVIVLPIDQLFVTLKSNDFEKKQKYQLQQQTLRKRENNNVFTNKRDSSSCYSNQLACIESTDSCSGHGTCSLVGSCWKCLCSPTKDSNDRTSYWTGSSCEKQDYSSQFNLLFWTTIILLLSVVSGIKLMYQSGNEELPGVLLAATVQTKKAT